jgi:hypothetical protein
MSDPKDTGQRSPLSSSGSHASGTSALSVSIQPEGAHVAAQDDAAPPPHTSEDDAFAPSLAEHEPEAGIEPLQPQAAGGSDEAAEQPRSRGNDGDYSLLAAELSVEDGVDAAPNPQDQPVNDAAAETAEQASAFVGQSAAPDEPDDVADEAVDHHTAPDAPPLNDFPDPTSELRATARQTIADNEARQQQALALFDQVSRRFAAALEEAGVDAARVTFKVMEFAQESLKNNLELAQAYAAARSVPDIFGLHAAYIKRQFELLNAQAEELREITAKITLRSRASLRPPADQTGKTFDHR